MHRIVIITVLTLGLLAEEAAAQCYKWANQLSDQDFGLNSNSPEPQLAVSRRAMFTEGPPISTDGSGRESALQACTKFFDKIHPEHGPVVIDYEEATYVQCSAPICHDRSGNWSCHTQTSVQYQSVTRQPCCNASVRGPYYSITRPAPILKSPTQEFSGTTASDSGQKGAIAYLNQMLSGFLNTDLMRSDVDFDYYMTLSKVNKTYFYPDDPDANTPFVLHPNYAAQVDHIIPRVDINGCLCGTNEYKNALVISAKLNNEMKNYCDNPKRVMILTGFAAP